MSPAALAALKASLANPAHAWQVRAWVAGDLRVQAESDGGDPAKTVNVEYQEFTAALSSGTLKDEEGRPVLVNYVAQEREGVLHRASVFLKGRKIEAKDAALHATVKALGAASVTSTDDELLALLT